MPMPTRSARLPFCRLLVLVLALSLALAAPLGAQNAHYWQPDIDNEWDDAGENWNTAADGSGSSGWVNGPGNIGDFQDFAGAVTITGGSKMFEGLVFEGDGALLQDGALVISPGGGDPGYIRVTDQATINSVIEGAGQGLVIEGGGHLTLGGVNTYTGGATVTRSTLTLTNGQAAGAGDITLVGVSALALNFAQDGALAVGIRGAGAVQVWGDKAVTLNGGSTYDYAGATSVNGNAALILDGADLSGTTSLNVQELATLAGAGRVAALVANINGNLKPGEGSSSGSTLAFGGDLALNSDSTSHFNTTRHDLVTVAGKLEINNNAKLDVTVGAAGVYDLFTYGGTQTGAFDNDDITTTAGFDSKTVDYTGGKVTLAVSAAGQIIRYWQGAADTSPSAAEGGAWNTTNNNWSDNSTTASDDAWGDASGLVGIFGGTGGPVAVDAAGVGFDTLQFKADGYTVSGGDLNIAPANGSSGVITVDGGLTTTISSAIAGTGKTLDKQGGGTLALSGNNSYGGDTSVAGGLLRLDAAQAINGNGSYTVADGAWLGLNFDGDFGSQISGDGNLSATGDLKLTSAVDIGGLADIASGTFLVDGATGSLGANQGIAVHNGATFGVDPASSADTATLSATTVESGGNFIAGSGGAYESLELKDGACLLAVTTNTQATVVNDTLKVSDQITLNLYQNQGLSQGQTYILLTSNGTHNLDAFTSRDSWSDLINYSLSYDGARSLVLTAKQALSSYTQMDGVDTPNRHEVAKVIDRLRAKGDSPLYIRLNDNLDSSAGWTRAMDLLSGDYRSTLPNFFFMDGQAAFNILSGHLYDQSLQSNQQWAYGDSAQANQLWFSTGGIWREIDGDGNAGQAESDGWEAALGYEARLGDGWLLGLALRGATQDMEADSRRSQADLKTFGLMAYAGREFPAGPGAMRLTLGAGWATHDIESERRLHYGSLNETLKTDYDATSWQVFGEAAWSYYFQNSRIEPYLNLNYHNLKIGSYRERGGLAALQVKSSHEDLLTTNLGARLATQVNDRLALRADLAWQHNFGDLKHNTSMLLEGAPFNALGAPISRNAALIGLGADLTLVDTLSLGLDYQGALGNDSQSHSGRVTINLTWD